MLLGTTGNAKLAGFALAWMFDPSKGDDLVEISYGAICGTLDYTAPEVTPPILRERHLDDRTSLWSKSSSKNNADAGVFSGSVEIKTSSVLSLRTVHVCRIRATLDEL